MPVYSYSPSKTVFVSEMKYTASQFTLIHCLEPDSIHQAITTPPSPPPPVCHYIYHIREFKQQDGSLPRRHS